jgi:hypothetical protein
VRALKPPLWASCAENHLCTYDLYSPVHVFGPQMALAYRLDAISQGPKNSQFPGPNPLPFALVNGYARIQNIMHGAV